MDEAGHGRAWAFQKAHELLLETHSLIAPKDRIGVPAVAARDLPVALPDDGGNMGDFPTARLSGA